MITTLFIILGIVFCGIIYFAIRAYIRYNRASNYIMKTINYWKKNPAQMELSIATTGQIVKELLSRPIPIILISPVNDAHHEENPINLNIVNLHPEMATMLLFNATQMIKDNGLYGNPYESDND